MAAPNNTLYITCVEKQGAFLKIWGQIDKQLHAIIEKSLQQMTSQFDQGHCVPSLESIQVGILCCAKYKDGAYYRARITNTTMLPQNVVEVQFIDYGNREIVPIINLRTIASFAPGLITIPGQARDFILANVTHHGLAWDNGTLALINSEIRYMDLQWSFVSQVSAYTLIKLYKNGEDLAQSWFNRGMILSIASTAQHMILQNTGNAPPPPAAYQVPPPVVPAAAVLMQPTPQVMPVVATPPPALLTFKAISLEPGTESHVYVSYVSDGPCHFSVQLKRLEDNLARLMKELNRMNLQPLEDDPLPGTVCVARCVEDDHICRAVVTSMVDSRYKVFYVDFGNTEVVPIDNLYQIPFKYVIPKVMAMRYALAGMDRSSVSLEMKCVFKEYVSDKLLRMKTLPPPTRSALPLCVLWDDANNVNVQDILLNVALNSYPEPIKLTRSLSQEVRVSYVHSCSHFYVQVKSKEEELREVMAELQVNCPQWDSLQPTQIRQGQPCCALFDTDGQWYRAQILAMEGESVRVRYVDYGNEELVVVHNLKIPPRAELLTALRPQALECCLNGYQNMPDDLERDNILEELILEKEFTMKVIEMQGSRALVELNDSSRYNVGSLLLERLASAHSQVSPLLIQDSHHIEQRKRKSPNAHGATQAYRLERKQSRDQNDQDWNSKSSSNEKSWNSKPSSNDKDWSSSKQVSNDKGWSGSKPTSNDGGWNSNKQDSWRQTKSPRNDDGESFDNGRGKRDRFNKKESWGDKKENWGDKKESWGDKKESWGDKKEGWGGGESNWKKNPKSPNQNEGNEKGWSDGGGEKNWRRSNSRTDDQSDDRRPRRKPNTGDRSGSWKSSSQDNTWSNDNNVVNKVLDPAPFTASFLNAELTGTCEQVSISWFHDPGHFFCQLQSCQAEFRKLMDDLQNTYCKIKPESVPVGAPAIALFPDDGVRYRVCVLEVQGKQYRVQYVDFGNVSTTDTVWPIEKKFMQLPAQAISCGLNGIIPPESGWPDSNSLSTYFDKESFTCSFISSENNKYLIDLTCDNQNITEGLVSAGLVMYQGYDAVQDNFDPSILLGQQIRVTLGEVQSLSSFYVQLQNEMYVLCAMHNLESATETFEDTLKQCIGSVVLMYVDNVLEQITEVTLYDQTGTKLKIVEPDEGSFETVELPCPLPVVYSTMSGWISFLVATEDEKHRLFIQPSEFLDTLTQLLDDLFNHYNSTTLEAPLQLEVGALCVAHSADSNWYRAQVASIEEETVTVTFIDYGNSESLSNTELRELSPEFKDQHMLALEVLASGVDESFSEQEVTATLWYGENGWEGEIVKASEPVLPQQNEETSTEAAVPTAQEQSVESEVLPDAAQPLPEQQIEPQTQAGVPVILSHTDSPSEFYLQLSEDLETIDNLQATLQEQVESFSDLENPAAGSLCAAPYSLDQQWYRAQVLDADSDITTVRFVDYGNTDVLSNDTTRVKTLPPELLAMEQHARRCSLIIKPVDDEWSPTACERFEQLTQVEQLNAEIIHQDEKSNYVQLYADGVNVADVLLQENLAAKLQLETESSCSGYLSHLNSPSEFWVQLENSVADLEWVAEQLSTAESFPELEDLTPGSLCAALFPDDEMWHRARILSNTVAGLEVLFIDYGNSCTCTSPRQLPEDLIMLPALAQKCSLQKPAGILQWSAEATEIFKTISADGATIFNIDKLTTGETSVVRLLIDGNDIATELLPKTQDAYISHFESISSFWIQKAEDSPKLDTISQQMEAGSEWPKYDQKETNDDLVAALYFDDEKWYRAKILGEKDSMYEVLFVDFGNASTVNDIRILPSDIGQESPLASNCKLDTLPGSRWNDESSKQLTVISNEGSTLFQVEFVSEDVVRLYLNGSDIRSDLDSTCVSSLQSTPKKSSAMKTDTAIPDIECFLSNESELLTLIEAKGGEKSKANLSAEISKLDSSLADVTDIVEEIVRTSALSEQISESPKPTADVDVDVSKDISSDLEAVDELTRESEASSLISKLSETTSEEIKCAAINIDLNLAGRDGELTSKESATAGELTVCSDSEAQDEASYLASKLSEPSDEETNKSAVTDIHLNLGGGDGELTTNTSGVASELTVSSDLEAKDDLIRESEASYLTPKLSEPADEETNKSAVTDIHLNLGGGDGELTTNTSGAASELTVSSDLEAKDDLISGSEASNLTPKLSEPSDEETNKSAVTDIHLNLGGGDGELTTNTSGAASELTVSSDLEAKDDLIRESEASNLTPKLSELSEEETNKSAATDIDLNLAGGDGELTTNTSGAASELTVSSDLEAKDDLIRESEASNLTPKLSELSEEETNKSAVTDIHLNLGGGDGELTTNTSGAASELTVSSDLEAKDDLIRESEASNLTPTLSELSEEETNKSAATDIDLNLAGGDREVTSKKSGTASELTVSSDLGAKDDLTSESEAPKLSELSGEETNKCAAVNEDPNLAGEDGKLTDTISSIASELTASHIDIKNDSSSENVIQPPVEECASSNNPTYSTQRRSSTPHCDKIVPGSVCRGDLTEVENNSQSEEMIDSENTQRTSPVAKKAIKDLPQTTPSNLSSCKVALDERIVPGCVSRGETPEPSVDNTDIVGAVNGIESKNDTMT